jgi:DNA polymerase-3 subunit gamma/tau
MEGMMQLYQKHRSHSLEEIYGQEKIVDNLQQRFKDGNHAQSYVLAGETGLGKTTIARIIAMAITCDDPDENGNPCKKCEHCLDIINENFALATTERNCSNLNIDAVRALEDETVQMDFYGKPKVFILDEYQEMEHKASKNILKMIENVNPNCHFIITSMERWKIPEAVRNRSQNFIFKPLEMDEIAGLLCSILDEEKVEYPPEFFDPKTMKGGILTIAYFCNGSPRNAISMLEDCILSKLWTDEEIRKHFGFYTEESIINIMGGILTGDYVTAFKQEWTNELMRNIRSMFVTLYKSMNGVEDGKEYRKDMYKKLSGVATVEQVAYILDILFELNRMSYLTTALIEFYILKAMRWIRPLPLRKRCVGN